MLTNYDRNFYFRNNEERILIAAPRGRDASLIAEALAKVGHHTLVCHSIEHMSKEIENGGGVVFMTEEAFADPLQIHILLAAFHKQPSWSDLPFLICHSTGGDTRTMFASILEEFDRKVNLIRIERPLYPHALVTAVRTALRGRRRQYLQRDVLQDLERAKEFADAANRAKSAFLTNMSHELRMPLNAIIGFAELLGTLDLSQAERLQFGSTIQRNGQLLTQLIDDLLDLSKVEAGKLVIERIPCQLPAILEEVIAILGSQAREKDISLELLSDGVIPSIITSDPMRLKQILLNIIGNTIKFTSRGGVEVTAKYIGARASNGSAKVMFTIKDTGRGISSLQAKELFQPFMQADASTTRAYGGTGLGLVLSRRLTEALGGSLELTESTFGSGSTFTITIEVGKTEGWSIVGSTPKHLYSTSLQTTRGKQPLSGLKILVAEDSEDSRNLICIILKGGGAEVDLAHDGFEAVSKGLENDPDLILMDIQMPQLDGLNAESELRQHGFKKPIIALTAHAMQGEREKCLRAGCNDHLTKPINIKDLFKKVSACVLNPGHLYEQTY